MARVSCKRCLAEGYDAIQSANFWAAVGDAASERAALATAREWFDKPPLRTGRGRAKGQTLRHQVDERMRKMRE